MTAEQILEGQVFLVDKPLDWTSFQAVNKIKFKLKKEFKFKKIKVGHAGTLDPKATGLLVVCTGRATKKRSEIQDAPYDLARAGASVEMKSRKTTIHYIKDIQIEFPYVRFLVGCSKGTYIRSLAHDIGQGLGVGAYLTQLRRTKIGEYSVEEASGKFLSNEFLFSEI